VKTDRRDFLKMIGLGGIALTIPKPLALLAGVERTPFHVGRLVFPSVGEDEEFVLGGISIAPRHGQPMKQIAEFFDKWALRIILRNSKKEPADLLRAPVGVVSAAHCVPYLQAIYPAPHQWSLRHGGQFECWLKPGEAPRYPLPEVDMLLHGLLVRKGFEQKLSYIRAGTFQRTRVDHGEARRLGIIPSNEPADDFAVDSAEEVILK